MFKKDKKYSIKDYQEMRKGRISIFGYSILFDWFVLVLLGTIIIALVFYFSIVEINHTINYEPDPDGSIQRSITDEEVLKDLNEIIDRYE